MTHTAAPRTGFQPTGQLHFGVSLLGPAADTGFDQLRTLAQTAERGLFSLLTLDERYWLAGDPEAVSITDPKGSSDVATLLAGLAAVTTNIGLAVAAAPDYDDPAGLVHRIASLDKMSGGRAAWQLLADTASWRGGESASAGTDDRQTYFDSAQRLWDAWGSAAHAQGDAQGPVEPLGEFQRDGQRYSVGLGQLRQPRPRYRPVILHAGDAPQERAFAARHADVVTSGPAGLGDALAFRRDMLARSQDAGRGPQDMKIIQAGTFILAETDSEAQEKANWIRGQLPESAWDVAAFIGSYGTVADLLLDFARSGAVDGFGITPWLHPAELDDVVNHLVPELQERGIYPEEYTAASLRDNLGFPKAAVAVDGQARHALPVIEVGDLEDIHLDLDIRMELVVQKLQP
jgi:alkanesulfonate monooxygenase SsuD/methylene tetrahydromethanopterin reductase-like flavin-dependent oxidoreductase (luciferase family)